MSRTYDHTDRYRTQKLEVTSLIFGSGNRSPVTSSIWWPLGQVGEPRDRKIATCSPSHSSAVDLWIGSAKTSTTMSAVTHVTTARRRAQHRLWRPRDVVARALSVAQMRTWRRQRAGLEPVARLNIRVK